LDVIGIRAISDTKLLFAYPKKKQYGMKDYKKDLGKILDGILKLKFRS
jgi:hypothetical protein